MLNEAIFKDGLKKLVNEFEDKGFKISQERAAQWYNYMKNMQDEEYKEKIDHVIKNSTYSPCMADILKASSRTEKKKNLLGWDD